MDEQRLQDLLALSLCEGVGWVRYQALLRAFASERAALEAGRAALAAVPGIGPRTARAIAQSAGDTRVAREERERARHAGVRLLPHFHPGFPPLLREIYSPPLLLYVLGDLPPPETRTVAVVGTRRCSLYGRKQARRFGRQLAERGFAVVSGMARGVDTEAHRGALEADGCTVAVLGSGLLQPYPPENRGLMEEIARRGAVLSEFPLTARPSRRHFPRRNRIIAGLSLGVLVVEASLRSGALSTARWALEQNREVFALPGRIDAPQSTGTNHLLSGGACLVSSVEGLLEELPRGETFVPRQEEDVLLRPEEEAVLSCLEGSEADIESLVERTGLAVQTVSGVLLRLEMKGLVRQFAGKTFAARD